MKKLLAILFSMVLVLGLFAGCGEDAPASNGGAAAGNNAAGNGTGEVTGNQGSTSVNPTGMLVLNANAAVNISYDASGLVTAIEGINESGNVLAGEYEDFLSKPCSEVVSDLIAASKLSGFLTEETAYVAIKQAIGSTTPSSSFLLGIEKDAKAAIEAAGFSTRLVLLTTEDLDEQGYINVAAAQKLMMAYMATDRTDFLCVGSDAPLDGLYGFLFGIDDVEEKLIVDAVSCDVFLGELDGVIYGDEETEEELTTEPTDTNAEEPATEPTGAVEEDTQPTDPSETTDANDET